MISLTATELPRFMACNGSLLMGGKTPISEDTTVRDEGNAIHWMIEQVFNGLGSPEEYVDRKAPNGVYITPEMIDDSSEYLEAIIGRGEVECDTSYSDNNYYQIRGRSDHIDWSDSKTLYVDDFKYGYRVVSPEKNWTLISHAFAKFIRQPQQIPDNIVFRIFQPRGYHYEGTKREWGISYSEFSQLCQELVETLCEPNDKLQTGDHCYKCPHMSQCPAAQIALSNAIDVSEKAFDNSVSNDTLAYLIDQSERAIEVIKRNLEAYEDLAISRLKIGQNIKGRGLENALCHTQWNEGLTPELLQMLLGVDLRQNKLVTPAQAKRMGVDTSAFCNRPSKGVKMVKVDLTKKAEKLLGKKGN